MSTSTHSVTAKSRLHINNEDAYFIGNDFVVIADGMGGESNGEIASRIAVDTISTIINDSIKNLNLDCTKDYIENVSKLAVTKADTAISQYVDSNPDSIGMGTTILLAIYKNETLYITWCGDSHCYVFRDNHLQSLTKDHSYVQELIDAKTITAEEALTHPDNNLITRYVGGGKEVCLPEFYVSKFYAGDILVLCSDGLSGYCNNIAIENKIRHNKSRGSLPKELKQLAIEHGSDDDITIVTIHKRLSTLFGLFKWILQR